jgi:bacterial/archaeal transporter family-2 protein
MSEAAALALAFLLGAMISIYQPMNGSVSRMIGSPLLANVIFYFIGCLTSVVMLLASGGLRFEPKLRTVPPLLYTAGIMSAIMVLGTIILLPRLGARRLFILQVAGQVLLAMFVAHFGLLGLPQDPLTVKKLAGAAIVLIGAVVSLG